MAENQPLLQEETPMEVDQPQRQPTPPPPEPSPKERALEAFKRKLIEHREYDQKLKNRTSYHTQY